jgi:hypothetical protein
VPSLFAVPDASAMLIVGLGNVFTVTEAFTEAKQAVLVFVTVTVYDVVDVGETTLLFPVPPGGLAHA